MDINKLNRMLCDDIQCYKYEDLINLTKDEEQYFYKWLNPMNINSNDRTVLVHMFIKYDNVYLLYDIEKIQHYLIIMDTKTCHYDTLFYRYIDLSTKQQTIFQTNKLMNIIKDRVDLFINVYNNQVFRQHFISQYNSALDILFKLLTNADIQQTKILNNIINELLDNTDKDIIIKKSDVLLHLINALKSNAHFEALYISPVYIQAVDIVYRTSVNNLNQFINFLNFYVKYWDTKTIKKFINNKITQVKVHQHAFTKQQIYEEILLNVHLDTETRDILTKTYKKLLTN